MTTASLIEAKSPEPIKDDPPTKAPTGDPGGNDPPDKPQRVAERPPKPEIDLPGDPGGNPPPG